MAVTNAPSSVGLVESLIASPAKGVHVVANLKGPGLFLTASVLKHGGVGQGVTGVLLELDGRRVVAKTLEGTATIGLQQSNPLGLMAFAGTGGAPPNPSILGLAIGLPYPLRFESSLVLTVTIGLSEVTQLHSIVMHGKD